VEFTATILATKRATWTQTRSDNVERVILQEGTFGLRVRTQQAEERFFVDIPEGTLESRGGAFEVRVVDGETDLVRVQRGSVLLRLNGYPEMRRGADESWMRSPPSSLVPAMSTERPASDPL
jgi:ferric-dicitrate binding protein FerR (iron transport regulator)